MQTNWIFKRIGTDPSRLLVAPVGCYIDGKWIEESWWPTNESAAARARELNGLAALASTFSGKGAFEISPEAHSDDLAVMATACTLLHCTADEFAKFHTSVKTTAIICAVHYMAKQSECEMLRKDLANAIASIPPITPFKAP